LRDPRPTAHPWPIPRGRVQRLPPVAGPQPPATRVRSPADGLAHPTHWSDQNKEVDFVLHRGDKVVALEIKTGRRRTALPGLDAFAHEFPTHKMLLVGGGGIPLEEFLATPPDH